MPNEESTATIDKDGKNPRNMSEEPDVVNKEKLPEGLDLTDTALDEKQKDKLIQFLKKNHDLFSKTLANPGSAKNVVHRVPTDDNSPINCVPFKAGVKEKTIIKESIDEMLKQGVIRPSYSPWAAPVVLGGKKDWSVRFCID